MSLFSLVLFIYIAIIIAKAVIKSARDGSRSGNSTSTAPKYPSSREAQRTTIYVPKTGKQVQPPTYQQATKKAVPYQSAFQSINQQVTAAPKSESRQGEQSTVEYLAHKAEQETQERAVRQNEFLQKNGNRVGIRLVEGDLPPSGTRVIKCSYCGAENLVPQNASGKFSCYFCREDL